MGLFSKLFSRQKKTGGDIIRAVPTSAADGKKEDISHGAAEKSEPEIFVPNAPALMDGLQIQPSLSFDIQDIPYLSGARVLHDGTHVITVNEPGRALISMADGKTTVDEMIERLGIDEENAFEAAMFFVALGKAGYLKNKYEIRLYENNEFIEVEQ